ncbi:hypothetical protein HZC09_06775 [Candidatus Micrarchaeota archaeon]|nr:hypothetical protein [Candidatus Micrarchaeota archaeon]
MGQIGVYVSLEHYKKAIAALMAIRENYRRMKKMVVIPRQAILEGDKESPESLLRNPHIVSEVYPVKRFNATTPVFLREQPFYCFGGLASELNESASKEHVLQAVDVMLELAERGVPAIPDLFGLLETPKGLLLSVRDPDSLAINLAQIDAGNKRVYLNLATTICNMLSRLGFSLKENEITSLIGEVQKKDKLAADFKVDLLKRLELFCKD